MVAQCAHGTVAECRVIEVLSTGFIYDISASLTATHIWSFFRSLAQGKGSETK